MWPWQNHPYVNWNNNSSNNHWSSIERIVDPSYLVFGYKATICDYCSEPKLERILYKNDTNKAIDEISHNCNTINHLQSSKPANDTLRLEKNNITVEAQKKTALALKQVIIDNWLIKGPIYLMAAGLSNLNLAKKEFGLELDHNNKDA